MTQPATIYLSLETRDTKGTGGQLYAAHRCGQFILFDVNDGTAQVLFLEKAAEPGDVPRVVFQRLTDVKHAKQIGQEDVPRIDDVVLSAGHDWTEADRAVVQAMLGTDMIR